MRKIIAVSVFVLIVCVAQVEAGEAQFTLYGGYLNPKISGTFQMPNIIKTPLDQPPQVVDLHGSGLFGARAEYDFNKKFGIEEFFGFTPRLFNEALLAEAVQDPLFPDDPKKKITTFTKPASAVHGLFNGTNLIFNIPLERFAALKRVTPYFSAGLGMIKTWGTDYTVIDPTLFAANYGGGIKLNGLYGRFGGRFDVRMWRTEEIKNNGGANLFEASVGVTYTLGSH